MMMKNKHLGFTFIEMLVALFVVTIICVSFTWLFVIGQKITRPDDIDTELAWHVFLIQFENAADKWQFDRVENNCLYFIDTVDHDKKIIIKQYQDQIKKAKNQGYEPLLFNIKKMDVNQTARGVKLEVTFNDNSDYQAFFNGWE